MTAPTAPTPAGAPDAASDLLLDIDGLGVAFPSERGPIHAVRDVRLTLRRGEVLAVVGESGSGKSVTALTLLGLTRGRGTAITGKAEFDGIDLIGASDSQLRRIRGKRIAMVFQDPMSSLNPVLRIGHQIAEQIRAHEGVGKAEARKRTIDALTEVGIPRAAERVDAYPHEFSGGMRQRVMIAMALVCGPELLIADEPTTALDVTVQAQILDLILRLRDERGMSVMLVTHDLGVVAETADQVAVMYGGRIVEQAPCDELFADPRHPYSWGLIGSIPPLTGAKPEYLPTIAGTPPSPLALPAGCPFRARCPHEFEQCAEVPPLAETAGAPGHLDRCWLPIDEKRIRRAGADGRIGLLHDAEATTEESA
ncbi:MAG: ABC transporter ATP-binding protein [Solirubrobacteraceae bacterium]|nr:ABC transporter ATP-binding protein [Solirubrobacteraceae bacterium]